jgi:HAD superfamily hydrolase (TIGR01509 family)
MLKAIILDFNGVILDDEPLHFSSMRDTVIDFGINLTKDTYWEKYLPMDDAQCLQAICRDFSIQLSDGQKERALARKSWLYRQRLQDRYPLFPGALQFVKAAAERYPLALASGARREEIEATLSAAGLERCFTVIVAAEDFVRGKPHPDSFLLSLERLNEKVGGLSPIQPKECLVIEDSIGGIHGAHAAGMICLAVSNSYPIEKLQDAEVVVASLEHVQLDSLVDIFKDRS